MTKPIVTFAALKCVELGLIDLDKPVHNFHSDLKDLEVGKLQNGKVIYERANKDITLHHLLAHTSGFAYDFHDPLLAHLILEEKIAPLTDKEGNLLMFHFHTILILDGNMVSVLIGLESF